MEGAIFELEIWGQEKTHAKTFDYCNSHTRHVLTFLNMDNEEDAMRKLLRYQTAAGPTTPPSRNSRHGNGTASTASRRPYQSPSSKSPQADPATGAGTIG
jgi:hypothetical protein